MIKQWSDSYDLVMIWQQWFIYDYAMIWQRWFGDDKIDIDS